MINPFDEDEKIETKPSLECRTDESQTLPEGALQSAAPNVSASANFIGRKIGQYTLLQSLGEGGMGTVYRAEQTEPIRRIVALKIIRAEMITPLAVSRFELERQALAVLDHENIAKVFDGGTTPEGQPYFTMELIKGVPITKYCDGMELPLRARMELFVKVCRAIQHAHQRGIIHRDIKPANVLVAIKDDKPVPKVIDFGLARSVNQKQTDLALTISGSIVGTIEYMSPEQAVMNAVVSTQTDVYSLGILLYELITGTTPLGEMRIQRQPVFELLRMVRESYPAFPSRKIAASPNMLAEIAAQRNTHPSKLVRQIVDELDWITMKALEKDLTRRYATPYELNQDVERFLNNEPVEASPPSTWYRLRKTIHRNKGIFGAACAIVSALVLGLGVAIWQMRRAEFALADLREAAPHYFTESQQLAEHGKLEEARAKIEFALRLIPDNPDWLLHRAHLQEALGDYTGAVEGYRIARNNHISDTATVANLKFCQMMIKRVEEKTVSPIDKELLSQLKGANLIFPTRMTEELWEQFSRRIAMAELNSRQFEALFIGLRKLSASDWDMMNDIKILDGKLELNFNYGEFGRNKFKLKSLTFLEELPIRRLKISNNKIDNLSVLKGSEIESLELWGCPVSDLSPLADCKSLRYLGIAETNVRNIKLLVGLNLKELRLRMAEIDDVSPLASCKTLESIELPDQNVKGIAALRALPNLQRIGYDCVNNTVRQTATEFWRDFDKRKKK